MFNKKQSMNRKLLLSVLAAVILSSLTSCFNDDTDYDYYQDVSLNAFSLSAANKYYTVPSYTNTDSTVKKTVTVANYNFVIDQNNRLIYNPDSLPKGTDAKHILCSVTATYAGAVGVKSAISDTINSFSTSDSLDFTTPRKFIVYNAAFSAWRTYTVTLNIHKEDSLDMMWTKVGTDNSIANMTAMKAVTLNNKVFILGNINNTPVIFGESTGFTFARLTPDVALDVNAYKNAVVKNGKMYILNNGKIMTSANGTDWTTVGDGSGLKQIVGAGRDKIFALTETGFASSEDGATWTAGNIDSDVSTLPYQDITFATRQATVNSNVDQVTVIGNRNVLTHSADTTAVTWAYVDDYENEADAQPWMLNVNMKDSTGLPSMANMQAIYYGDSIIVLGGKAQASYKGEALTNFYYSGDGGVNWKKSYNVTLPSGMNSSNTVFAMTRDDDNNIWIICGSTGEIWRGRLAYVSWKKPQNIFK